MNSRAFVNLRFLVLFYLPTYLSDELNTLHLLFSIHEHPKLPCPVNESERIKSHLNIYLSSSSGHPVFSVYLSGHKHTCNFNSGPTAALFLFFYLVLIYNRLICHVVLLLVVVIALQKGKLVRNG